MQFAKIGLISLCALSLSSAALARNGNNNTGANTSSANHQNRTTYDSPSIAGFTIIAGANFSQPNTSGTNYVKRSENNATEFINLDGDYKAGFDVGLEYHLLDTPLFYYAYYRQTNFHEADSTSGNNLWLPSPNVSVDWAQGCLDIDYNRFTFGVGRRVIERDTLTADITGGFQITHLDKRFISKGRNGGVFQGQNQTDSDFTGIGPLGQLRVSCAPIPSAPRLSFGFEGQAAVLYGERDSKNTQTDNAFVVTTDKFPSENISTFFFYGGVSLDYGIPVHTQNTDYLFETEFAWEFTHYTQIFNYPSSNMTNNFGFQGPRIRFKVSPLANGS